MNSLETLIKISKLFQFKKMLDSKGNAYIFFEDCPQVDLEEIEDKTEFEAFQNHVHLFDKITKAQLSLLIPAAKNLGQAILDSLQQKFPERQFMVFASLRIGDSMILRFHQVWPGEPPYCNVADFNDSKEEFIYLFQNKL